MNQSTIPLGQTASSIWYLGNGNISYGDTTSYIYNQIGNYPVTLNIQTAIGCKDSLTQIASIIGSPEADFTYNPFTISTLKPEINFTNTSLNATPFMWILATQLLQHSRILIIFIMIQGYIM